ncbi:succinate dehydrogenase assembly factor 2 [Pseudoxanthomonas sp. CAU 1598]|uniref:FAD assembly factor SdhE n=2 Tax=Pseudomarimonas arenosa TaxID=2774145 RepID=A0AAW3ZJS5_9GAMM|nr:succinate dehydrogenase assembly factor 2 [Pseudomarimonas arenosa]
MRELDQLMERYLDRCWFEASTEERARFEQLLATEDDKLWRWFMGREPVDDPALRGMVERLLQLPP